MPLHGDPGSVHLMKRKEQRKQLKTLRLIHTLVIPIGLRTDGQKRQITILNDSLKKNIQEKRISACRKKLNITFKNDQGAKKPKPEEKTTKKCKKGEFDKDNFVTFARDNSIVYFSDWINRNSGTQKDKILVKIIYPSKKEKLSM